MFKALGDPVRLRLMSLIASTTEICVLRPDRRPSTCPARRSPTTCGYLREAGLVGSERRATWVYYWAKPEALRQLSGLLEIAAPTPA